jgi:putative ABC transport system permease protein
MFFTYLRRELRRRMRQATFIAIGLALGIGLVITVTAASAGVKNAQGSVLHSLYGVGTDITVSKTPAAGSGAPGSFGFRGNTGTRTRPAAGTKINVNNLRAFGAGTIAASSVSQIARLPGVAAASGGLTLTDTKITGKIPAINSSGGSGGFPGGGGGGFSGSFTPTTFTVDGVDIANGELGPLSNGKLAKGSTFTTADENSDVALLDSNYATQNKLTTGSTVNVAGTNFKVVGVVSEAASDNPPDVYIPLARAQALGTSGASGSLKNDVTTVYVAASSSNEISTVQKAISHMLPGATVTTSSSLASEVTGSITSAASLANNLGKWLAIAVLIAAFCLAALLTMSSVTRRVREFGTLKALGWPGRRIVGQVMGESLVIGIIGGAVGVGLGFAGASIVSHVSKPLTASLGTTTGSSTPGGSRVFGGGFPGGGSGGVPGGGSGFTPGGGNFFRRAADAAQTVSVHLSAPVTIGAIVAAVLLAVAGGLIAGGFGGWRAGRMRPAAALARVE